MRNDGERVILIPMVPSRVNTKGEIEGLSDQSPLVEIKREAGSVLCECPRLGWEVGLRRGSRPICRGIF